MPSDGEPVTEEEKPKRRGKKAQAQREMKENVVHLFGEAEGRQDPDGLVPKRDKTSPRQETSRIKVRGRWAEVMRDIKDGKMTMKEFVAALDPEELARGQMRAEDGTFRGAPPRWVPAELHQACVRELMARGDQIWKGAYLDAIKVFTDIAKNEAIEPKDRIKAAQYVVERIAGKTPEKVELSVVDPWEQIIGGIVAEAEDEAISRAARVFNGMAPVAEDG